MYRVYINRINRLSIIAQKTGNVSFARRIIKMADCSGRFDEKLKAITEEAQEALVNLEATLKGGGVKKKGTKRRVDILYDSSGKTVN